MLDRGRPHGTLPSSFSAPWLSELSRGALSLRRSVRQVRAHAFIVALLLIVFSARPASPAVYPDARCKLKKLTAAAKFVKKALACEAQAARSGSSADAVCSLTAHQRFQSAFLVAEAAGGCPSVGDFGSADSTLGDFIADAVIAVRPAQAASRCSEVKLKAIGKVTSKLLLRYGKAVTTDFEAIAKGILRSRVLMARSFSKAAALGDCEVAQDSSVFQESVERLATSEVAAVNAGFADVLVVDEAMTNPGWPAPVTLNGSLQVSLQGFFGSVTATYGNGGRALIDARPGPPLQISIGSHTVDLREDTPDLVSVDGTTKAVDEVLAAFRADQMTLADPASWSPEGQAVLALAALVSTDAWARNFTYRVATGSVVGASPQARAARLPDIPGIGCLALPVPVAGQIACTCTLVSCHSVICKVSSLGHNGLVGAASEVLGQAPTQQFCDTLIPSGCLTLVVVGPFEPEACAAIAAACESAVIVGRYGTTVLDVINDAAHCGSGSDNPSLPPPAPATVCSDTQADCEAACNDGCFSPTCHLTTEGRYCCIDPLVSCGILRECLDAFDCGPYGACLPETNCPQGSQVCVPFCYAAPTPTPTPTPTATATPSCDSIPPDANWGCCSSQPSSPACGSEFFAGAADLAGYQQACESQGFTFTPGRCPDPLCGPSAGCCSGMRAPPWPWSGGVGCRANWGTFGNNIPWDSDPNSCSDYDGVYAPGRCPSAPAPTPRSQST